MSSTSTSNSKAILSVQNLNLVFRSKIYRPWTFRDAFVSAFKHPWQFLLSEPDRFHVLNDLNFEIGQSERVGLIGINGAGKTSLCRCLAGLYLPSSGQVNMIGRVRAIFDFAVGIQPELTGRENAELLMEFLYPEERAIHHDLISEALEFSELGDFIDAPFRTYSNGMQARLCLSLVTCRTADLLILDEVFEGADQFFKEKIANRIMKLIQKSGAAILVSHSPEQISRVCNRLIILKNGKIAYDGSVTEGQKYFIEINRRPHARSNT